MIFSSVQGQPKSVYTNLTTTNATDVFTANENIRAYLNSVSFSNVSAASATVSLLVNDGTTDTYVLKDIAVAANTTEIVYQHPVVIPTGSTLRVQASTSNAIDVVSTIVQITAQGIMNG